MRNVGYDKGKTSLTGFGGWQWHRLDTCKQSAPRPLHTDNHTNTPSLDFYERDALADAQPTASMR